MKLSKMFKIGAVALMVTSLCFVGCKDEDDEADVFSGGKVDFDNAYVKVANDGTVTKGTKEDGIENTEYYYRAFKQTKTKHRGGICEIKISPNVDNVKEGVAGFVFDLTDGKTEDTYNFCIVACDWSGSKVRTYVSRYSDVLVKNNNFTKLTNFSNINGEAVSNGKGEDQILPTSGTWEELDTAGFSKAADGTITIVIKAGTTSEQTNGAYTVGYYTDAATAKSDGENNFSNAKKVVTIETKFTGRDDAKTQSKLAYYVNITPGKHYTANFDFSKTFGEAVVFEDDSEIISE
ncbi:hypothetical protein [uncultured Treponema sp.]|uniref:hypothetical protein n=1 Tax=uncultured Treponema sp. TaxID=162155 RepID=UPI0025DD2B4B|nr:hypothetical protein [uncultured Treponema sp.]